jgi:alkylated DNA repair dioxygenase AlkB
MQSRQTSLIPDNPAFPAGFSYTPDLLSEEEEREMVTNFAGLAFRQFEFHGYLGKRRVVSFGHRYDFSNETLRETEDLPQFLIPTRDKAAASAGLVPSSLEHALITEYRPGAAIGWHKDKAVFAEVIGISLLSACTFRFRRNVGARWERASFSAEPRSAYLLAGAARTDWEHSIPAVESLRYSITFRSLRPGSLI